MSAHGRSADSPAVLGLVTGLAGGVIGGAFGVGGGVVMVPVMVLVLRMRQVEASASSLAAIAVGTISALIPFIAEGRVLWVPGAVLAVAAMVGSWLGTAVIEKIPVPLLAWSFVAMATAASVRMLVSSVAGTRETLEMTPGLTVLFVAVGLFAGMLGSLLGAGGGVVYVPALVLLVGLVQHTAQGTSLLAIVPSALVGSIGHARAGRIDWRLVGWLVIGTAAGGFLGATVAQGVASSALQVGFGILQVTVAIRMAVTQTRRARIGDV